MDQRNFSFAGKILRVDLTSGRIWTESTSKYTPRFLGGRGVDNWILYDEVKPWVASFDPANRLIFGTGVLVGTLAPTAARHSIDAKSPMTGGVGSANSCGHFSPELKFAGYDHIVFQGRARSPVYLWIDDSQVKILDASHIWGRTVGETNDIINEDLGNAEIQIACIGPAGEYLVRSACIITNRARAAGRCGLGAVMGSKNLKAVAVRGSGQLEVVYPERFMKVVDKAWEKLKVSPASDMYRTWGVYRMPNVYNEGGHLSVRNFQDQYLNPDIIKKVDPEIYKRDYEVKRLGYFTCPLYASHFYKVTDGPYAGLACEGFHVNDLLNWIAKFEIDYPPAMIKLHSLCSEYGLDQDNSSSAIAWALECFQRGILTRADTDGLELEWSNHELVAELLKKIAYREGIGDLLAEGAKRASEVIGKGSEKFAIHVKGQDSIESMRGCGMGWALGCVVSTRGGTHTRGAPLMEGRDIPTEVCEKLWGIPKVEGPRSYENKAKLVVYYERLQAIIDSLNICLFTSHWTSPDLLGPEELAELYSAATGNEITGEELMMVGERIHNVEKAFNVLHVGFSRKDDYPPQRFMEEPIKSGPNKGELLSREKWDRMLDEYYELHGWDKSTGWQTRRCLEALDLNSIADDLENSGRLPD
ncbi:aldehyde ferredoxin oxidoreductase family protein [Chloroflexota bacterium]